MGKKTLISIQQYSRQQKCGKTVTSKWYIDKQQDKKKNIHMESEGDIYGEK